MSAFYQITNSSDGQFHFVLKADNAQTILTSQLYAEKKSAQNGIASVQTNCNIDKQYERMNAKNDNFYFNLKSPNNQVIGTSQMYTTTQSMEKGIESVKANGAVKNINDKT